MPNPTPEEMEQHTARKAEYLAAKLKLIYLCENCHREIYLPERQSGFIHDCAMPKWLHRDGGGSYDRRTCWNDPLDGTAWPMSESDLEELHDKISEDDWYYET